MSSAALVALKSPDAFRTISEVAADLDVPQHVLRFWETKFPQVRPLKRGGGRRYYRPEDVQLLRRVADLLYTHGYTIKGVQRLLREGGGALHDNIPPAAAEDRATAQSERGLAEHELLDLPEGPAIMRKPAPPSMPQLPMPGLLPDPEPPGAGGTIPPRTAQLRLRPKHDPENQRLRALLTETLGALEELRKLLD